MDSSRRTTSKTQEKVRKVLLQEVFSLKFLSPLTKTQREARFYYFRKSKDFMKKL